MHVRSLRLWRAPAACALALLLSACNDDATPARDAGPAAIHAPAEQPEVKGLVLVVRGGSFAGGRLQLDVAVTNPSASAIRVPRLGGADLRLEGRDGSISAPLEVSPSLERIGEQGVLLPVTATTGRVLFLLPGGRGRHVLRLAGFAPLPLDVDRLPPLPDDDDQPGTTLAAADPLRGEIMALLVEQAAAMRERDMRRYLATLTPDHRRPENSIAPQLRAADVGTVDLRLADAAPLRRLGIEIDATVELTYWIADLPPDMPFVHRLLYRFERNDGRWFVRSVEPAAHDSMPFWTEPGVVRMPSDHFVIFTRSGTTEQLLAVSQEAERAYARLQGLRLPLRQRYAVHVIPEPEFHGRYGSQLIGVAIGRYAVDDDGELEVHSVGVDLDGALFDDRGELRFTAEARQEVMNHELVHLALMQLERPATPAWLVEGAAVYFAGEIKRDTASRLAPRLTDQLSLRFLTMEGSLRSSDQYDYAGLAVEYIVKRFGMDAFSRLYHGFAALPVDRAMLTTDLVPELRAALLPRGADLRGPAEELVLSNLGVSLAEVDAGLKAWIRWQPRARRGGSSRP